MFHRFFRWKNTVFVNMSKIRVVSFTQWNVSSWQNIRKTLRKKLIFLVNAILGKAIFDLYSITHIIIVHLPRSADLPFVLPKTSLSSFSGYRLHMATPQCWSIQHFQCSNHTSSISAMARWKLPLKCPPEWS